MGWEEGEGALRYVNVFHTGRTREQGVGGGKGWGVRGGGEEVKGPGVKGQGVKTKDLGQSWY